MKWKTPKSHDKRTVRRFLFLPVNIKGVTKWLCWATMEQEYFMDIWVNVEWIDTKTQ